MAKILLLGALFACMYAVSCRPQAAAGSGITLKEGCREGQLFNCASSIIAFFLSAEGQKVSQLKENRGQLKESDFNNLCRVGQTTIGCFDTWVNKCVPAESSGIHIVSRGTVKLLNTCNETNAFPKFSKLMQCAEKLNDTHKACGEMMKETHKNVNYRNPKAFLARESLQQDVCCNLQKYNQCYMPKVEPRCGQEGKALTDEIVARVYNAYECSPPLLAACPTA